MRVGTWSPIQRGKQKTEIMGLMLGLKWVRREGVLAQGFRACLGSVKVLSLSSGIIKKKKKRKGLGAWDAEVVQEKNQR